MAKTAELDMGWLLTGKTSDTHAAALERAAGAKIMNFVLKRGILYQNHTKTRNSVSKTRNFAFKMMDFAACVNGLWSPSPYAVKSRSFAVGGGVRVETPLFCIENEEFVYQITQKRGICVSKSQRGICIKHDEF